jgi:histidine triad (HIT) family protein
MTDSTQAGCPFCQIIRGAVPADIVLADETAVVILDHRPLFPGHCLVIPRGHYATLADLPAELLGPLFADVQLIARAIERGLGADGSFVAINNKVSQSVPHLHVHVIPRRHGDGLKGFFWPRQKYESAEQVAQVREALRMAVAELKGGG